MRKPSSLQGGFGIIESFLIVVIVGVIGFTGWYVLSRKTSTDQSKTNSTPPSQQNSQVQIDGKYTLFEGTLTNINRGCDADGVCSMTVDDQVIITGGGLGPNQEANTWGTTEADFNTGEKVTVKALKDEDNYTLHRCAECYVRRATPR